MTTAAVATPLSTLARQIDAAHQQCEQSFCEGLAHALEAGRLLIEAKAQVGHGGWLPWLAANCTFTLRLAQKYMRVARELSKLDEANTPRVAYLSFREALTFVASNSQQLRHIDQEDRDGVLTILEEGERPSIASALSTPSRHDLA